MTLILVVLGVLFVVLGITLLRLGMKIFSTTDSTKQLIISGFFGGIVTAMIFVAVLFITFLFWR